MHFEITPHPVNYRMISSYFLPSLQDDMNLTDEKKAPLRAWDIPMKRNMLDMQVTAGKVARSPEMTGYNLHKLQASTFENLIFDNCIDFFVFLNKKKKGGSNFLM